MFIGVDVDQFISVPGNEAIMLSSVLKRIDNAVFDAVEAAMGLDGGQWASNLYIGTLENEGVGMAPFHEFEDDVPADLVTEIDGLREALIAGDVTVADWSGQPPPSAAP
jgi:basic membrane protein A